MAPMNCATVKWSQECDNNFSLSSTLECHRVHLQSLCAGPCTVCKTTDWGWGRGKNLVTNYSRRWKQNEKCCSQNMVCQKPGLEHLMERRKLSAAPWSWWLWTSTWSFVVSPGRGLISPRPWCLKSITSREPWADQRESEQGPRDRGEQHHPLIPRSSGCSQRRLGSSDLPRTAHICLEAQLL